MALLSTSVSGMGESSVIGAGTGDGSAAKGDGLLVRFLLLPMAAAICLVVIHSCLHQGGGAASTRARFKDSRQAWSAAGAATRSQKGADKREAKCVDHSAGRGAAHTQEQQLTLGLGGSSGISSAAAIGAIVGIRIVSFRQSPLGSWG